jgi:hypothetical protein
MVSVCRRNSSSEIKKEFGARHLESKTSEWLIHPHFEEESLTRHMAANKRAIGAY